VSGAPTGRVRPTRMTMATTPTRIRIEQTNATTYGNLHREIAHKQDTGGGNRFRGRRYLRQQVRFSTTPSRKAHPRRLAGGGWFGRDYYRQKGRS
jgi:hypothetical protein